MVKTSAFLHSAQGKAGTMPELSVQQVSANQHQLNDENLGFSSFSPRKVGHEVRAFREASAASGAEEDRTPNLGIANAALSQLSYRPSRDWPGWPSHEEA